MKTIQKKSCDARCYIGIIMTLAILFHPSVLDISIDKDVLIYSFGVIVLLIIPVDKLMTLTNLLQRKAI